MFSIYKHPINMKSFKVRIGDLQFSVKVKKVKSKKCKKHKKLQLPLELFIDNQFYNTIKGKDMALTLVPNQTVRITLPPTDRKGRPVNVDGVTFSSDSEAATVTQDPNDKLSAIVVTNAVTVPTGVTIKAQVDARLGEGERILEASLVIEVRPEEATGFGEFIVGPITDVEETPTPEPKPEPNPPVDPTEPAVEG